MGNCILKYAANYQYAPNTLKLTNIQHVYDAELEKKKKEVQDLKFEVNSLEKKVHIMRSRKTIQGFINNEW